VLTRDRPIARLKFSANQETFTEGSEGNEDFAILSLSVEPLRYVCFLLLEIVKTEDSEGSEDGAFKGSTMLLQFLWWLRA
jgi:hypothetical protein